MYLRFQRNSLCPLDRFRPKQVRLLVRHYLLLRMHRPLYRDTCTDMWWCAACGIAILRSRYDTRIANPSIMIHRWIDVSLRPYTEGRWPSGLERWTGDQVVLGLNPAATTSLRNFGNAVYPALPVYFGGDTKSCRSLLSGVMPGEVKDPISLHWKCVPCRGLHHS